MGCVPSSQYYSRLLSAVSLAMLVCTSYSLSPVTSYEKGYLKLLLMQSQCCRYHRIICFCRGVAMSSSPDIVYKFFVFHLLIALHGDLGSERLLRLANQVFHSATHVAYGFFGCSV